jgi:signal transduction histidine kinase
VEGSYAQVEVSDTGCGMSEEFVRTRLFKPFQTTKSSGMGIGAYESFQYLQELGGKIKVHSEVDRGTRITILLPLFHASKRSDLGMLGAK